MKKIIIIVIAVVVFLGTIIGVTQINTKESFNSNNQRDSVKVELLNCENKDYTLTINNGKYILINKSNQSVLSGNCKLYSTSKDEQSVLGSKNTYYVACYFYEHNTSKGTEYYFDKPNGFYALVSKEGKLETNINDVVNNTDDLFF